ncbi:MAG: protein kinase [Gemmataceae bacterium]
MLPNDPNDTLHQGHAPRCEAGAASSVASPSGTIVQTPDEAVLAAERSHAPTMPPAPPLPEIPGYEILGELGRGGMGVVYRARDLRLNRPTAIKMLLGGQYADPFAQVRFLGEAEIVALIHHPNVVQVFEFGQHDGLPFFVLEFVEGVTLAKKLHEVRRFSPRAAAEMVAKLADAIAAAHAKGIVHRDLKPANVLLNAQGEPKVTDFGLAKVGRSDMTASGAIMGTPDYMSPEQAAGRTKEISTATDVYALGVILYELLTGRTPFKGESPMETIQRVLTCDPEWPCSIVSTISRDLETICLKCLERNPEKRYSTAEALAADLRAYLEGRPIAARPNSSLEIAVKWARRRPTMAALLLVSLLGVCGIVWKYVDAEEQRAIAEARRIDAEQQKKFAEEQQREAEEHERVAEARRIEAEQQKQIAEARRKEAEEQRETAIAVSAFLGGLFEDADPLALTGRMFGTQNQGEGAVTAAQIVDRAALKLKTELKDQPRIRAALLDCIGGVYLDQGRAKEAEPLILEAVQLRQQLFGDDHLDMAMSMQSLGILHLSTGELEKAGQAFERALALRRKYFPANHALIGDTLFYLGVQRLYMSENAQAEPLLEECLKIRRKHDGRPTRELALVLLIMGQLHFQNNDPAKGLPILVEAATIMDSLGGKNDFSAIVSLFIKAQFASKFGSPKRARELYKEADAKATKILGQDHYVLVATRSMYADFLGSQGDTTEEVVVRRSVVEGFRKSFGPDSLVLCSKLLDLARAERALNRFEAAEAAAREAVRIHRKRAGQSPKVGDQRSECLHVLGSLVYNRGDATEANAIYREALAIRVRFGFEDTRTQGLARDLVRFLLEGERVPTSPEFLRHDHASGKATTDFEFAKTWAQGAEALRRYCPKLTPDDELCLECFRKRAVNMLRSAVAAGMRDAQAIEAFADFKPLRDRADFQDVVRELAAKR